MGYDLHIMRRNDFENREEESNITLEEWKNLVESSDDLTWQEFPLDPKETDFEYCYWLAHPEQDDTNRTWFNFWRGAINTKNPDFACMRKLVDMSGKLDARVEGDDGEVYTYNYII